MSTVDPDPGSSVADAVRLEPMKRRHLRAVMRVEADCYPNPWSTTLFLSELAQRQSRRYTVASIGPMVVGYCGLMVVTDEGHITTVTVDPTWQAKRVGTVLLLDAARAAPGLGIRHLTLEVRTANDHAQALYRRFGFAPAGIRRNYYAETGEDALVMWAHEVDTESYRARLDAIEAQVRSSR